MASRPNETHPQQHSQQIPIFNPEANNLEEMMVKTHNLGLQDPAFSCTWIDPSIYEKRGIIVQFLSTTVSGHPSAIGIIRLAFDDIRKLPAYLEKYETNFRI